MATYLPGNSNYQNENSTSYLGDQKPLSYLGSASNSSTSMIYLNQASTGEFSEMLPGSSLSQQNCVQGRTEMSFISPTTTDAINLHQMRNQLAVDPRTQQNILDGDQNFQSQGLSLSLGTQIQSAVTLPSYQYQFQGYNSSMLSNYPPFSGKGSDCDESKTGMEMRNNNSFDSAQFNNSQKGFQIHSNVYQYEPAGFSNAISNSKYLKATQELLDEVVNVRKALKQPDSNKDQSFQSKSANGMAEPSESVTNSSSELSPAEKQDLQNKKSKLLSMLDEVDRRYKQYYHQMKVVVSSFDMVAGNGAAKPYTALALQTISRHFRCLRDAISTQIQVIQKSLGEQDTSSNQTEVIPRLRFLDHQLRQQRALQQLGVMRNAWRPQRGLPESSVSILRAWLFEHFLHPYPKDSEKILLAKQTGLTRNQVANWFINARVRLWKPMIEEMYKEEFGELEANSKSSLDNTSKAHRENSSASEDIGEDLQENIASKAHDTDSIQLQPEGYQQYNSDNIPNDEINRPTERSMYQNFGQEVHRYDQRPNLVSNSLYVPNTFIQSSHGGDAMYDLPEMNDFGVSNNQVSLALGLRHQERMSEHDTADFHCIDSGNQQDRFANPHVLHDFVV